MYFSFDIMKNGTQEEDIDIFDLILLLRHEKLLVRNERNKIQELNELVRNKTHKIIRTAWITTKQRLLLYERDTSPKNYRRFDLLSKSEFIDAKQTLGFQVSFLLIRIAVPELYLSIFLY